MTLILKLINIRFKSKFLISINFLRYFKSKKMLSNKNRSKYQMIAYYYKENLKTIMNIQETLCAIKTKKSHFFILIDTLGAIKYKS
jgi:hypothetical protein